MPMADQLMGQVDHTRLQGSDTTIGSMATGISTYMYHPKTVISVPRTSAKWAREAVMSNPKNPHVVRNLMVRHFFGRKIMYFARDHEGP